METIHIFVGPKKTGTSWLHHVVGELDSPKEIRYPSKYARPYVYKAYVENKSLLIWPYLLHEPDCLEALLADLKANSISAELYVSYREPGDLRNSMIKFKTKYGFNFAEAERETDLEIARLRNTVAELEKTERVHHVRIIDPNSNDLQAISHACDIPISRISEQLNNRVYETNEVSRFKSYYIVRVFFILKPFLPKSIQSMTRLTHLRNIFFKPRPKL